MSIHKLQEKIRKTKAPLMAELCAGREQLPPHLLEQEGAFLPAYIRFCQELMEALQEEVPALRLSFNRFAMLGPQGLAALSGLTETAKRLGYYVLLDIPDMHSPLDGAAMADAFFHPECPWYFDGLAVGAYCGSDALRELTKALGQTEKDLFVLVRTANRSASDLQDLLTGGRLVHTAAADLVCRYTGALVGKSGYSRVAAVGSATAPDSLRAMRSGRKELFLLADGLDLPGANAKNCAYAFDRLGHGAIACVGAGVAAAWKMESSDGTDYTQWARKAAVRFKNNLSKYITIL